LARSFHGIGFYHQGYPAMIRDDGWQQYSIWEHSAHIRELYAQRCHRSVEEMICHAQAAELLAPLVSADDILLDVGCGSGYFFHSLKSRNIAISYFGLDASRTLINIGRRILPAHGLPPSRLIHMRIDDLAGEADHMICLNVLSNLDNYHRPLERMLQCSRKTLILRESLAHKANYRYVVDEYLDPGCRLRVHVNTYCLTEVIEFIESFGFNAKPVKDCRSGGRPEMVIGYPHHWTFIVAQRVTKPATITTTPEKLSKSGRQAHEKEVRGSIA
jgi:SAM-dependent methyltransferase